jgi:hypothetical protein
LDAKLLPLVEEFKEKLGKLAADQGGRLVLEKGDDLKDLRKVLKAAAAALNRRVRFPFRGRRGRSASTWRRHGGGGRRWTWRRCRLARSGGGRGRRRARTLEVVVRNDQNTGRAVESEELWPGCMQSRSRT